MKAEKFKESVVSELFDAMPETMLWLKPRWQKEEDENNVDFEIVYCNEAACRFLQLAKENLIGLLIKKNDLISKEDQDILFKPCVQVWLTGEQQEDTFYMKSTGRYFHALRSKAMDGVVNIIRDCTEQHLAEKEKLEQMHKYHSILDATADGVLLLEAIRDSKGLVIDFRIAHCNRAAVLLGRIPTDIIGRSLLEVYPHLRGSDQFKQHVAVVETGIPARLETTFRKLNGVPYGWFIVSLTRLGDSVISNFVDITEKKRNEQKIEEQAALVSSILKHSPSGISVIQAIRDKDGTVIDGKTILANDATELFTGLPNALFLSATFREIDPHIFESPIFQMAVATLTTGEPCHTQYFFTPTGRWLEISLSKMDDDHLINVFTDITDSKKAQLEQEKLLEKLKQSNTSLEEFAYAASHDLQEPLRKIHMFSDRLKTRMMAYNDKESIATFERMEAATLLMRSLIQDLLFYSSNSLQSEKVEPVALQQVIQDVLEDTQMLIEEKQARFAIADLPILNGRRRQFRQLFQNLISNALKYGKEAIPPFIAINSHMVIGKESGCAIAKGDREKPFHLITIKDNGIGFDQHNAEKIFKVFQRLHKGTEYAGTGVGLAIARRVVENHNGYIWAESKAGEGAAFHILIPA